jgi:hypothetical protein
VHPGGGGKSEGEEVKRVKDFIEDVKRQVERAGGTCFFPDTRTVDFGDGSQVNGYWDEENLVLACAMGQPFGQQLRLVAHEFGHFRQWIEQRPAYVAAYADPNESWGFGWVEGANEYEYRARAALATLRNMELDCERVTLRIIREYHLPIDVEDYIQRAAAYVYFYHLMAEYRTWYIPDREPYNIPEVLALMPTDLDGDFDTIPDNIHTVMANECLGLTR